MGGRLPTISALVLAPALAAFAWEGGAPSLPVAPEVSGFVVWTPAVPLYGRAGSAVRRVVLQ